VLIALFQLLWKDLADDLVANLHVWHLNITETLEVPLAKQRRGLATKRCLPQEHYRSISRQTGRCDRCHALRHGDVELVAVQQTRPKRVADVSGRHHVGLTRGACVALGSSDARVGQFAAKPELEIWIVERDKRRQLLACNSSGIVDDDLERASEVLAARDRSARLLHGAAVLEADIRVSENVQFEDNEALASVWLHGCWFERVRNVCDDVGGVGVVGVVR
jgi:hypothetical protein